MRLLGFSAISSSEWLAGLAAGCDRLVHPSVVDLSARGRQARLLAVLIAAPFLTAGALAQVLIATAGPSEMLAAIFALFGAFWVTALVVATSGRATFAGVLALGVAVVPAALALAADGGASPTAALLAGFLIEPAWVWRSRKAAKAGLAAAAAALALAVFLSPFTASLGAAPSAWNWLMPLAYTATVWLRLVGLAEERRQGSGEDNDGLRDTIEAVVLSLGPGGEVTDASDKARDLFNLAPELVIGSGFFDRIHVADRVAYLCALADLREGAASRRVDVRLRLPAATGTGAAHYRPFLIELGPLGEGRDGFILVARSGAELVELRETANAAAEAMDGVEVAKGRFLAAVSHELRTPLNAIIGFSDMLAQGICGSFADPRQKEYVGLIRDSGHHLLSVVNAILDVSKIEAGTYPISAEPFRFADAVAMCHSMLSFQAGEKAIGFTTELGRDAGEITADRRAVQQMLINLASNAIKFTPAGGKVVIGARRVGSRLHFWVSDTGIGIGAADLSRLGQPFMQVHNDYTREYEGTGLGLSLVKGLVALHDGTMTIDSTPDEGTTVTISLPVAGPSPRRGRTGATDVPPAAAKERTDGALRKTA